VSFPRYPKYRDSGVEWLGQVPAHWIVRRLGALFRQVDEQGHADLPVLTVSIHDGVSDDELDEQALARKVTRSVDRDKYKRVQSGDLVYNMMRAWQGGFGTVAVEGMVSPAYVVARPLTEASTYLLEAQLRTPRAVEEMRRHSQGVTDFRLRLYWDEFKTLHVVVPPPPEERIIGAFVKQEVARIEALVAEQDQLIELLKEKRHAIISHAVTKGLNPNAPQKPSGIDWLGEIPAHWAFVPFASAIRFQEGPGIMAADFRDEGVPLLRVAGVQGSRATLDGCNYLDPEKVRARWEHFRVQRGDLLLSASASLGTVAEVGPEVEGAVPYTGLIRLTPADNRISRPFIRAVVSSSLFATQIDRLKAGATIQHFGPSHLRQMRILLPPIKEQELVVEQLDAVTRACDLLTSDAEAAMALLQERRAALIAAAVTGQIDVRGLAEADVA
jgi:type I restriction enzyme S subunit